jgi:UDP-N-acetylmuramate--alanine ligase
VYKRQFIDFVHKTPFYGSVAVCLDDHGVQSILKQLERTVLTYSIENPQADFYAQNIKAQGTQMHFDVIRNQNQHDILSIQLNTVGQHNVKNALACIAIADELEISDEAIIKGLAEFKGVGRRFQHYGTIDIANAKNITVIDDYGHHPIELKATLEAARGAYANQRLVLVFQPHRYTRTRDLFEDFADVLSTVDGLILTEVYSAGETKIANADSRSLARHIRLLGKVDPIFIEELDDIPEKIIPFLQDDDILLCMGAGTIGKLSQLLINKFSLI